jgi:hypothetical protein
MSTQQVDGSAVTSTSTNNNGGSVVNGGTTTVLNNVSLGSAYVMGTLPIDGTDTNKSVSGGDFAYDNARPVAKRYTTALAGVSNTALLSGAAVPGQIRSIHKLEVLTTRRLTTAIRANKYNRYTGAWDNGYPVVAVDSLATDYAATPSRSAPGQLTYKLGQPVPVSVDYAAKTGG